MRGSMTATNMQPQIDEQTARTAWRAFGSYIAKTLVNGKGVLVPKFGIFTFGPVSVDLAVSFHLFGLRIFITNITVGNHQSPESRQIVQGAGLPDRVGLRQHRIAAERHSTLSSRYPTL